jgi:2-amino-4-hydroxy-6-hydroxymethyldihydropteridine diphosphokinase
MEPTGELVAIALGGNLGEVPAAMRRALALLAGELGPLRVSSLYRSPAQGAPDQPPFLNAVAAGRASVDAAALLRRLLEIEAAEGRVRSARNAARTLDLDLLAVGEQVIDTPGLALPHPRMHHRPFVLVPLAEVAPGWRHPLLGRTAAELAAAAPRREELEREAVPGWEAAG